MASSSSTSLTSSRAKRWMRAFDTSSTTHDHGEGDGYRWAGVGERTEQVGDERGDLRGGSRVFFAGAKVGERQQRPDTDKTNHNGPLVQACGDGPHQRQQGERARSSGELTVVAAFALQAEKQSDGQRHQERLDLQPAHNDPHSPNQQDNIVTVITLNRPGFRAHFLWRKDGTMPSKYDENTKVKAVRLVREHRDDYDTEWAAMRAISARLGMSAETLRKWVRQSEVDAGEAGGRVQTEDQPASCVSYASKNRELESTIEILKAATSFFARELRPGGPAHRCGQSTQ